MSRAKISVSSVTASVKVAKTNASLGDNPPNEIRGSNITPEMVRVAEDTNFTEQYFEITKLARLEYGDKTIVLMQNGKFMEVCGIKHVKTGEYTNDTHMAEFMRICEVNSGRKKVKGIVSSPDYEVYVAGRQTPYLDSTVSKLQAEGFTIPVYMQVELPGVGADKSLPKQRQLINVYSPGTYFQPETSKRLTNNTACIWIEHLSTKLMSHAAHIVIGIANINIYTGEIHVSEYQEPYVRGIPTPFDDLERFISVYSPSEIVIISDLPTVDELTAAIQYSGISSAETEIHRIHIPTESRALIAARVKNATQMTYLKESFRTYFGMDPEGDEINMYLQDACASQALCYLLDFIGKHNPHLVEKISAPVYENHSKRLILANHSLKQLNIIPVGGGGSSGGVGGGKRDVARSLSSVTNLLNRCKTPMGKRLFSHVISHPTFDAAVLQREYNITEHMLSIPVGVMEKLNANLSCFKDMSVMERRLIMRSITPKICHQLHACLEMAEKIYHTIPELYMPEILDYTSHKTAVRAGAGVSGTIISNIEMIKTELDDFFDLQEARNIENTAQFHTLFIQTHQDPMLTKLVIDLQESEEKLNAVCDYLSELIKTYETTARETKACRGKSQRTTAASTKKSAATTTPEDADNNDAEPEEDDDDSENYGQSHIRNLKRDIKIHETEKYEVSVTCTEARRKILANALPKQTNIVVLPFGTSGQTFTIEIGDRAFDFKKPRGKVTLSHDLINYLTNQITYCRKNIKKLNEQLYSEFVRKFEEKNIQSFREIIQFITHLDMIAAKAKIARKFNYCKPELATADDDASPSFVQAAGLRHCIIEQLQSSAEVYVTNDLSLGVESGSVVAGGAATPATTGLLLYGTNAVGKSSLIKALGIAVILAQCGLYVPCSSFRFKPYKSIFTRILGNDNLFKRQSTFSVEMSELNTIIRHADANSLILGDELCSGTETASAIGIFVSGIQHLHAAKSTFIFATHFHEIVAYPEIRELTSLKLAHLTVTYDREKQTLVYGRILQEGSGDNRYGLEVCKSLHLPDAFLQRANEIRDKYFSSVTAAVTKKVSSVLDLKPSVYNSKKLVGMCEICRVNKATEVHHMMHQSVADADDYIHTSNATFHKNHLANLQSICEDCHRREHVEHEQGTMRRRVVA